jgi:predicted nucleic acid-binding protein
LIFIDSNVPMYLVGDSDAARREAQHLLERSVEADEKLVSDAEVLQEILHRYAAIRRRDAIQPAFDALVKLAEEIFPIEERDVEEAKGILLRSDRLSARDAVHVAVMQRHGVADIISFDRGFDGYPGIRRLGP